MRVYDEEARRGTNSKMSATSEASLTPKKIWTNNDIKNALANRLSEKQQNHINKNK
jgi:hypothetical protein